MGNAAFLFFQLNGYKLRAGMQRSGKGGKYAANSVYQATGGGGAPLRIIHFSHNGVLLFCPTGLLCHCASSLTGEQWLCRVF
ncbi:hypothetical protein JY446_24645 [Serratia marcescens]|nr:hypothetical protein [Serratia marcescens]